MGWQRSPRAVPSLWKCPHGNTEGLSLQPLHRPEAGGAEEAMGADEHCTQVGRHPCRGEA